MSLMNSDWSVTNASADFPVGQRSRTQEWPSPSIQESIFRKFAQNIKKDTKDEELKASIQKFEEKLTELNENEAIRKAKEIISKTKADVLKQNEAIVNEVRDKADKVKQAVGTVAGKVSDTLSHAAQPVKELGEKIKPYVPDIAESEVVKQVSKKVGEAEEKILENTNVYQYGGFKPRELREKSRAKTIAKDHQSILDAATAEAVAEDPNAGTSVVMHKESRWSRKWADFKDNSKILQKFFGMKRAYDESNNVFIYLAREITNSFTDRFASLFAETETAKAMKEIANRDPNFRMEQLMKLAREHIIPEILDAFLAADLPTLRIWCSEAMFNMLKANFGAQLRPGCRLEGKILDMRHLELITAKLLDETPVCVFSFNTQQVSYMCDAKGTVVEGAKDAIENVLYVMALAKEPLPPSGVHNEITHGWKLVELAIRDKSGSW